MIIVVILQVVAANSAYLELLYNWICRVNQVINLVRTVRLIRYLRLVIDSVRIDRVIQYSRVAAYVSVFLCGDASACFSWLILVTCISY